jgi:hypothetical protein
MESLFLTFDSLVIQMYRISGYTLLDFIIGTFVLAFAAVIVGEVSISIAFLATRKYIELVTGQVVRYHNLSVDAVAVGNNDAYHASNKLANDAFGKSFFMQLGLSGAFLWPAFFVLAWMQTRFMDVEFNLLFTTYSIGYIGVFITLYVASIIIFRKIKYKLPYFKKIRGILEMYDRSNSEMKSFVDIMDPGTRKQESK